MVNRVGDQTVVMRTRELGRGGQHKTHASLVVLQGAEIGRDFRLRRHGMIIGRGTEADVRLPDNVASREHARIERSWEVDGEETLYEVVDLGSTNGTAVNSETVERALLHDGDKIQIGETVLKFVLLDDLEASFHAEIRDRIAYDSLTGLLTKDSLRLALDAELHRCAMHGLPLALLMMDLDHFKRVNDTRGHLMGSHVLAEVGRLIRDSIRTVDVSARYGGEEFVSYFSESGIEEARFVAERVRAAIADHSFTRDGVTIAVTISIGVAAAPRNGGDFETLVEAADRALYRSKERGRNRVSVAGDDEE